MDVYMPICDGFKSLDLIRAFLRKMSEQGYAIDKQPYVCLLTAHFESVQMRAASVEGIGCIL